MLEQHLKEIGFSSREAKIYLELLKIGSQPASILAKRTGYKRSTVYTILKVLMEKGLLKTFKKSNVQYFFAHDPNALVAYLDMQCHLFEFRRSQTLSMVSKFREVSSPLETSNPNVFTCEGYGSTDYELDSSFINTTELCSYYPISCVDEYIKNFLFLTEDLFKEYPNIAWRGILPNVRGLRDIMENFDFMRHKNKKCVYLDLKNFSQVHKSFFNIYDEKVIMVHLERGTESAVIIQDKAFALLQKNIFDIVWNRFSPGVK